MTMRRERPRILFILAIQLIAAAATLLFGVLIWRLSSTDRPSAAFLINFTLALMLLLALFGAIMIYLGRKRRAGTTDNDAKR
ncbi:hypothetical protein [Micromonospora sp. KC213]|uniref:hypothetical protein n=1 Tax=Micromonospora sp. KC213 TaxID=2530378 RepID=UPI00104EF6EA|nr:hypothetical protein [Micromonospora sp. KC213]TDC41413.1 hypothetical protein E1166_11865 [Micromonospora sp. KC213]